MKKKINLISVKLYTEYYKNNIKDRYIRNYSDNAVIDNDVLKADYGEYVYITTLDKHNKLQKENKKYKEVLDKVSSQIKLYGKYNGEKCTRGFSMMSADFNKLLDLLKEVIK